MNEFFGTTFSGLTRRQFVRHSGWLVGAALFRPAGPLAQDTLKSAAGKKA